LSKDGIKFGDFDSRCNNLCMSIYKSTLKENHASLTRSKVEMEDSSTVLSGMPDFSRHNIPKREKI
jgi:hypothetical protein